MARHATFTSAVYAILCLAMLTALSASPALAQDEDEAAAQEYQEDLESAIRLARMDLAELQGLPLPSQ